MRWPALIALTLMSLPSHAQQHKPISLHPQNPHYFLFRDKPTILRDLLGRYGLDRSELLFVGDGVSDYEAAINVGVEFLARDTPDLHDKWMSLGVMLTPDLQRLPSLAGDWKRL
jgi:hypothetical protein